MPCRGQPARNEALLGLFAALFPALGKSGALDRGSRGQQIYFCAAPREHEVSVLSRSQEQSAYHSPPPPPDFLSFESMGSF